MTDMLERARESYARQAWAAAYTEFTEADGAAPLEPPDLELLATAAYLLGRDEGSATARQRAYHQLRERGETAQAARAAFWLGLGLLLNGEMARGEGWITRARRLLEDPALDCVEQGYLLIPAGLHARAAGEAAASDAIFARIVEIADRFGDADLMALGLLGRGQALVDTGEAADAMASFDEAMVAVTAGEVSPIVAGLVYCAVILACRQLFDLRRAQEWTAALSRWVDAQPDLVPFRGQCLVHRSEIMQLRGEWPAAMEEASRARQRLSDPAGQPAVGLAFYQQAELHRLRGDFAEAEDAYRHAADWGRTPQPGLALLWLAKGRLPAAQAAIRRVVDETHDPGSRAQMLAVHAEVLLAAGDVAAARAATDELGDLAARLHAPLLDAMAAATTGAVLLAEGDAGAALDHLRRAWETWGQLQAPYEAARVRVHIGLACRQLGDHDTAAMELDVARRVFHHLQAAPDLARVEDLIGTAGRDVSGLTARERQVLALVATGMTNRSIAAELVISNKTVARHVSNIFTKLDLSTRAAATAYAYRHHLV